MTHSIRYFLALAAALLFGATIAATQPAQRVAARFALGTYTSNSENSLRLMENEKLSSLAGGGLSYSYTLGEVVSLGLDLAYFTSSADEAIQFIKVGPNGPGDVTGTFYGAVKVEEYSSDLAVRFRINSWLHLGLGPTIAIVKRTFSAQDDEVGADVDDALSSRAAGLNAGFDITIPFTQSRYGTFLTGGAKLRYIHSISFDEKGRKLDDYNQSFISIVGVIGVGYAF